MSAKAADVSIGGNAQTRALGSSFYAAMRIMPSEQREAMFEIYSFCRAVDDIADDEGDRDLRLRHLDVWRDDLSALYRGETRPSLRGLATAIGHFDLARDDFRAVIDGMEMDIRENIQAPDFDTLDLYCDRVASAVGRLSVKVFRLPPKDGIDLAEHLGRALQLTNILRDLDEDAIIQRLYLPREYLRDAGIRATDPAAVLGHPALPQVCARIATLAKWRFEEADSILKRYGSRQVRTPRVMSEAYKSILAALLKRGWTPPRSRVRLSKPRLALILAKLYLL